MPSGVLLVIQSQLSRASVLVVVVVVVVLAKKGKQQRKEIKFGGFAL
jgi:hypothetical protein